MVSIVWAGGIWLGLSTVSRLPLVSRTWYSTLGVVAMSSIWYARVRDRLDSGDNVAHLPGMQLVGGLELEAQPADLGDLVPLAGREKADRVPGPDPAIHHPHQRHHPAVLVELRVEHQRPQRCIG